MPRVTEELRKEFKEIVKEIMRPELSSEEAEKVAERWARNIFKVMTKYGVEDCKEDFERLKQKNLEKIRRIRRRMGMEE